MPTKSTRAAGGTRSRSTLQSTIYDLRSTIYDFRFWMYKRYRGLRCHELAVQGRTVALQLRCARQGEEDRVERREEPARAKAPARGQEGRPHLLLPYGRREGRGRDREGAGKRAP